MVALVAHHLVQRLQRVLVPDGKVGVDARHTGGIQRHQGIKLRGMPQALAQHLRVPGRA